MKCRKRKAFTLVEIMIVVVLIGMLATMAVPAFKKVIVNSRAASIVNDLRIYTGAFRQYYLANGTLPEQGAGYALPAEMEGWIEPQGWLDGSADGGSWQYWKSYRNHPTVTLYQRNGWDEELLAVIEKRLDDSNLNGGMIQRSGNYIDYFWDDMPN